jgi:hypothetical protein
MMSRCYNTTDSSYPDWGGRGISVCPHWHDVRNFVADMGVRPKGKHSLGRVDNDGPYSPENCRWETNNEQARNRRNTRLNIYEVRAIRNMREWYGESLSSLAKLFDVSKKLVLNILHGTVWPDAEAQTSQRC